MGTPNSAVARYQSRPCESMKQYASTQEHCATNSAEYTFHMYSICSTEILVKRNSNSCGMGSGLLGVGKAR